MTPAELHHRISALAPTGDAAAIECAVEVMPGQLPDKLLRRLRDNRIRDVATILTTTLPPADRDTRTVAAIIAEAGEVIAEDRHDFRSYSIAAKAMSAGERRDILDHLRPAVGLTSWPSAERARHIISSSEILGHLDPLPMTQKVA